MSTGERELGTVKFWNATRGFGMLVPVLGGADVFVHASKIEAKPQELVEGETVSFEWKRGEKGPAAIRVRRTS